MENSKMQACFPASSSLPAYKLRVRKPASCETASLRVAICELVSCKYVGYEPNAL